MTEPKLDEQDRLARWIHMLRDVAKWFRDFPYPLSFTATADDLEAAAKLLSTGTPQPTIQHAAPIPQQSALVAAFVDGYLLALSLRERTEREVAELRLALDRPTGEKLGRCRGCQRPVIDAPGRTVWCSSCTADMAIKDKDDAEQRLERAENALQNVRMLAMRMRRTDPENAAHLLRFCEDVGIVGSVLRDME